MDKTLWLTFLGHPVWCLADTPYEVCHVAISRPAYQNSVFEDTQGNSYPASLAVDGSRQTDFRHNSCVHSNHETNPWWTVDLGVPLMVTGVFFTKRGDDEGRVFQMPVQAIVSVFLISFYRATQRRARYCHGMSSVRPAIRQSVRL